MTQGTGEPIPRYCPRCGGLMVKPQGSSLYWHADHNHPRCDITNIVESSLVVKTSDEPPDQPGPPTKGKTKK
jgi:ssDNA-binding Zn-finger/Zn-ribbon topoisomerase 1